MDLLCVSMIRHCSISNLCRHKNLWKRSWEKKHNFYSQFVEAKRLNFRLPSKEMTFSALDISLSRSLRHIVQCNHPAMKYLMIPTSWEYTLNSVAEQNHIEPNFLLHSLLKPPDHNKQIFFSFFLQFRLKLFSLCYQSEKNKITTFVSVHQTKKKTIAFEFIEIP